MAVSVTRRVLMRVGAGLAVAGLLAALAAFALPWGRYRLVGRRTLAGDVTRSGNISAFDAPGGAWYVGVLLLLAGLVALAWLGTGRVRQVAGLVAPVVGLMAAALAITTVQGMTGTGTVAALGLGQVRAVVSGAWGGWFAVSAAAMLGFAGGVLSLARSDR
jgi:hypothetical protein